MYNFIKSIICGLEPDAKNEFKEFEDFIEKVFGIAL